SNSSLFESEVNGVILFHHRAEIGCGKWVRTIDFAFKERRVADYSIPQDWHAIRSSEPERCALLRPEAMEGILRSDPTRRLLRAKDGGAGGSCNLTMPD